MVLIGKYEIHQQIGRGTMGTVYRARDTVLDRFVALKVLRTGPDLDPELKERFYREARCGARLQHPNLAIIYDLGEANNVPYIAMELLHGVDFRSHIEQRRSMPLLQKLELLIQVCDGLAHAHRQEVIHRDIKPSNIFIHESYQAKILDFGIARLPTSTLTVAGNVLGTPNYMSPEQIQSRNCDHRSDLFSAAIVFYEFLVYAHPFRSTFIPRRIAGDAPDSLYDHDPDIPPGLEELILKGLAKRPEDRVQSAEEFGTGFRRILDVIQSHESPHENSLPLDNVQSGAGQPATAGVASVPADDDSRGRRVSEFMRLSKDFDTALPGRDIESAREALEQMRALASDDVLLHSSLVEYEARFAEATQNDVMDVGQEQVAPSQAAAATAGASSPGRFAPAPYNNPSPTSHAASDESSLSASQVFPGRSANAPLDMSRNVPTRENLYKPPDEMPARNSDSVPPLSGVPSGLTEPDQNVWASAAILWKRVLNWSPNYKAVLIVFVGLIATLSIIGLWPREIPAEHEIGQAIVSVPKTDISDQPGNSGKKVTSLSSGTRVNVLQHLTSQAQQWIRVQYVPANKHGNSRPGYIRVAQLSDWSSRDPQTAWEFLSFSEPAEASSDQEINSFIARLDQFATQFPTVSTRADLDRAGLYVLLAQRSKDQQPDVSKTNLQLAKDTLNRLPASLDQNEATRRDNLLHSIELLSPPGPTSNAQLQEEQVSGLLHRTIGLWQTGEYGRALKAVQQILEIDPGNAKALAWQRKIVEAKRIEDENSH